MLRKQSFKTNEVSLRKFELKLNRINPIYSARDCFTEDLDNATDVMIRHLHRLIANLTDKSAEDRDVKNKSTTFRRLRLCAD